MRTTGTGGGSVFDDECIHTEASSEELSSGAPAA